MAPRLIELKEHKKKINKLVQEVQYWKILARLRANDTINLGRESNELRFQLSMLRNEGNSQAKNLETAVELATRKALNHLVHASTEIKQTMKLTKFFKEELGAYVSHIDSLEDTPVSAKKDRVQKVTPLIDGQLIEPVVAPTMLDTSNLDVQNPVTSTDDGWSVQNLMDTEDNNDAADSTIPLQREDEIIEDSPIILANEIDVTRLPDVVEESYIPDNDVGINSPRNTDNRLEGPSLMLDATTPIQAAASTSRHKLQPVSAELEGLHQSPARDQGVSGRLLTPKRQVLRERTTTVRRRIRLVSSPPFYTSYLPRPSTASRFNNFITFRRPNRGESSSQRQTDTERETERHTMRDAEQEDDQRADVTRRYTVESEGEGA